MGDVPPVHRCHARAAPDARKNCRSGRKSRQEAGRQPSNHSSSLHLERKEETVMQAVRQAEYSWLDGATPTQRLRSKPRIVAFPENEPVPLKAFPTWSFDGSSTYQAAGHDSDLILKPATFIPDPLRGAGHFLVLCEVLNPDGTPHATTTRPRLR